MLIQQDIYAAGSKNRPPMLNKDNYVLWSSRLLSLAKRRTDDELSENRSKGNLVTCSATDERFDYWGLEKKALSFFIDGITRKGYFYDGESIAVLLSSFLKVEISQSGMNMGQDRQMQMVGGNGGNQFRQYAGQIVGKQNRYNAVQNVENQNQNKNGNVVAARAEGNGNGNNGIQVRCYNCRGMGHLARNCTVRPMRMNFCLSLNLFADCSKGRSRDPTLSEGMGLIAAVGVLVRLRKSMQTAS
ncbi:retrovirus-related pol polyprotein from transposon TNT 1-94 [Tanacetum coccineum]